MLMPVALTLTMAGLGEPMLIGAMVMTVMPAMPAVTVAAVTEAMLMTVSPAMPAVTGAATEVMLTTVSPAMQTGIETMRAHG